MIFPDKANPAATASTDRTRRTIQNVLVDDNLLVSTNGKALSCISCLRGEDDSPRIAQIPFRAAKVAARRGSKAFQPIVHIKEETGIEVRVRGDEVRRFSESGMEYPNWRKLVPAELPPMSVGISPHQLALVATALGTGKELMMILHFDPKQPEGVVMVTGPGRDDRFALMAAVRVIDPVSDARENTAWKSACKSAPLYAADAGKEGA